MKPSPLRSDAHTSCLVVPGCLCQYQWGGISPTQVDMKYCKSPSCKLKHRCVKYLTNEWVFNLGLRGMECHDKVPFFFFFCFPFISIISLEYMCRFCRLCLGSPLRSEMEAPNHKKGKKEIRPYRSAKERQAFSSNTSAIVSLGVHPFALN